MVYSSFYCFSVLRPVLSVFANRCMWMEQRTGQNRVAAMAGLARLARFPIVLIHGAGVAATETC
jgi:hypothetical protein